MVCTMVERSPLLSALPDHLQSLLTSTLQTHSLSTWEIKEEGETSEVVYRLVFGKKKAEDGGQVEGRSEGRRTCSTSQPVPDRGSYQSCCVFDTSEVNNVVHPDSVEETKQGPGCCSAPTREEREETQGCGAAAATSPTPTPATKDGDLEVPARLACLADYEEHCRRTMSQSAWLYFSGGAMNCSTIQRNKDAFKNILIAPRQLVNVSNPELTYTIRTTGETVPLPIGISPTAFHSWATPTGEFATVGAAREAGIVYVSSIHATTKLEDIAKAEPQAIRWQQHKIFKDRSFTADVVRRAEKAGVTAIVLCIDKPTDGLSWDRMRGLTRFPDHLRIPNFPDPKLSQYNPEPTWDDVRWFCELTSLPVILKGVMTSESARMAVQVGAKGVIVSNHGGRTLDSLPATMEVLRDVVEAVGEQLEVFVDGGVMTGLDVFKALAYGARMVFIGRSAIWGLAHGGQAGLCHVIDILKEELLNVMKLAGTPTLKDITMERIYKNKH